MSFNKAILSDKEVYEKGKTARREGKSQADNPYRPGTNTYTWWEKGYFDYEKEED
jgi:hypothetical protein